MALQIVKDPAALPNMRAAYQRYAYISTVQVTGLGKILRRRGGSVFVSPYSEESCKRYQVIAPKWRDGRGDEWESLRQCYTQVLQMAVKDHCRAVVLPLLAEKEPGFPASIDYKIAVDTVREFREAESLQVFLLVSHPDGCEKPGLRRGLERFLAEHMRQEESPLWSPEPFGESEDPFDTLTPEPLRYESGETLPCAYSAPVWDNVEAAAEYCSLEQDWDEEEDSDEYSWEEVEEEEDGCAAPVSRKRAAAPSASRFPMASPRPAKAREQSTGSLPYVSSLKDMLRNMDAGFSETLLKLIDETGKKDSEIYTRANVSRQHFSKIRNNPDYKPTKPTAVAFAIALELDLEQTKDLIGRAGYALTNSSKFDVIIRFFIESGNYNMMDINTALFEFDQTLLGSQAS